MEKLEIAPFNIIGVSIRTTNENGQAEQEIGALWGQFLSENLLDSIPNKIDHTIYSLYTDYEGDHTKPYSAILGCQVKHLDQIPDGMVGRAFDGGNFMKTSAKGDLTKGLVVEQWMKIWQMDLDRIYSVDFEVFGEKAQNPHHAEVDFLVAIK